ncbi:MAG: transposase [Bacteroidota bacterium]|nr:transposase [Bacteroidota bacterium]
MANTYTQIYIQIVFCVSRRQSLISKDNKEELHKYITGIIQNRNTKLLAIHCMPDHIHILIGMKPTILLSDLVRDIKAGSSKFINDSKWIKGKFSWQEGYGAFSYSHSQLNNVINYINTQEDHHQKNSFKEEYLDLLQKFDVQYNDEYLFEWIE